MSTGHRKGVFLLLLLSHLASAQLNAVDHRPSRFSAQIAHHTELPYIRDPPEPENTVGGPLPETNNEANDIHAADGLGVSGPLLLPGPGNSGSPAASLKVTSSTRPTTSAPYGLPFRRIQYGPLHRSFKHTRKPAHFETTFKCTFDNHACGMRNQMNIGRHFLRMNNSIAGRSGFYMAVDAKRVPAGVSRLITPYLPGYPNSHVCLNLTYALIGPGAERIQVVAQDVGNRPLFSLEPHPRFTWRTFAINMTVHQDLRFFIEAYTNGKPGWVAIDDFKYTFNKCP
ncbi:uncharacterized protein [Dermacentor andersoni]|uniref:uncharacterized protein isoform X3 n=1 Tax=Dermacentor andersoni TaxID=34620 RepID=UPI0021557AAE|nr:uncharacterized protein LOC126528248 isoform X3 [Dermacentor andersoni]